MRQYFRFFYIALGMSLFLSPSSSWARSWDEIQKSGVLQAATEGQFAPFNFFEKTKLTGFEVDLVEAIAKKLGVKIEWKTYPFDSLLIGLGQNRYDLVAASHAITPEREKAVDFSNPHYCSGAIVVAKSGGPKTSSDLKGKAVGVQVGTTYLTYLQQKVPGVREIKTYPKTTDALQNLSAGRLDAWVTDKFEALSAVKANPKMQLMVGDLLMQEKIGIAVAKGNQSLSQKLNQALADLLKDGAYTQLSNRYFGQDIRCK